MLKIKNLQKGYSLSKEKIPVLKDINIDIKQGEFVALLGPSGCGKSTLLNILGGLDKPDSGEILLNNNDVVKLKESELEKYRLEHIGTIFQSFNLISHMSALENVEVPLTLAGWNKNESQSRAKELLKMVGLDDRMTHKPNQLSGGQKQRVAIARALALSPNIILADEPTGALDTKTGKQVIELLKKISSENGTTIIMVTHAPEIADEADHIISLLDGEIVSDTYKSEVKNNNKEIQDKKLKNMKFSTAIKHSYKNILQKKWRTLLVSIGGSIGICGIALMVGLGMGLESKVKEEIDGFLSQDAIMVMGDQETFSPPNEKQINEIKNIKGVKEVNSTYRFSLTTDNKLNTSIATKNESRFKEENIIGKLPTKENEIIISEKTAKKIINNEEVSVNTLLNTKINTEISDIMSTDSSKKIEFIITGIAKNENNEYIHNQFAEQLSKEFNNGELKPTEVSVIVNDIDDVEPITKQIKEMKLTTISNEEITKQISQYSLIIQFGLGSFAGISLIVSSIMIGIVLYISVLERIKEIGILRAIGARRKDIRRIFLSEAATIGFLSASLGLIVASSFVLLGNFALKQFLKEAAFNAFTLPPQLIVFCLYFSIGISLLAGLIPAFKASRLNPVDALRHE